MPDLSYLLIETGLLQFGWFDPDGMPFKLSLDMLPAYPDVLQEIARQAQPFTTGMDRLVCMADSLPFGLALSLATDIPLVYSRGVGEAHDLVGAYDIGHPALLLANTSDSLQSIERLAVEAHHVGLDIDRVLTILDTGLSSSTLPTDSLMRLPELINRLVADKRLPLGHGETIRAWLRHKDVQP